MKAQYRKLFRSTAHNLDSLISALAPGRSSSVDSFGEAFYDLLLSSHGQAFSMGRAWSSGSSFSLTAEDRRRGRVITDSEADYLAGFLDDLDSGRYSNDDGSLKLSAVRARAGQYVNRLRGTANESFVLNSDENDEFAWILGADENCSDCLELASLSPYAIYELHTMPGNGDTECRGNCGCEVKRLRDGKTGFPRL